MYKSWNFRQLLGVEKGVGESTNIRASKKKNNFSQRIRKRTSLLSNHI